MDILFFSSSQNLIIQIQDNSCRDYSLTWRFPGGAFVPCVGEGELMPQVFVKSALKKHEEQCSL